LQLPFAWNWSKAVLTGALSNLFLEDVTSVGIKTRIPVAVNENN
jgi:hypothetical protein